MIVLLKKWYLIFIVLSIKLFSSSFAQESNIPHWIKNNAKWWSEGQIGDSDFIKGIQYLVQNEIIKIPAIQSTSHSDQIPKWIKNNAGWWADGAISDSEFVLGIQYLVSKGVIDIQNSTDTIDTSICEKEQTAAGKETCVERLQQKAKLENDIKSATAYEMGQVTFYYLGSQIEPAFDKSILTIHFIVKNTGNSEITMSCEKQYSCNYVLSDGQKEIPYSANTLVYGSLTLVPGVPKYVDWTYYEGLDYQPTKNYSFIVKEPWGSGSISLKIQP